MRNSLTLSLVALFATAACNGKSESKLEIPAPKGGKGGATPQEKVPAKRSEAASLNGLAPFCAWSEAQGARQVMPKIWVAATKGNQKLRMYFDKIECNPGREAVGFLVEESFEDTAREFSLHRYTKFTLGNENFNALTYFRLNYVQNGRSFAVNVDGDQNGVAPVVSANEESLSISLRGRSDETFFETGMGRSATTYENYQVTVLLRSGPERSVSVIYGQDRSQQLDDYRFGQVYPYGFNGRPTF